MLVFLGWSRARSVYCGDLVEYEFGMLQIRSGLIRQPGNWFAVPFAIHGSAAGSRYYSLAHWFLILLFLLPGAAFLLWRGRRMKHRPPGVTPRSSTARASADG